MQIGWREAYQYVFSSMVPVSLSCTCFSTIWITLSNKTVVNHHQISFDIAFALIYMRVQQRISLNTMCFYRISRSRYQRAAASRPVDIEWSHNRHCPRDDIHHLYHHRCYLLLRAQDRWAGVKLSLPEWLNPLVLYNGQYPIHTCALCVA